MTTKTKSKARRSASTRNLIIRTCAGNPVAVVFLNSSELSSLRSGLSALKIYGYSPDEIKRINRIYEGIKPEAEIEVEVEVEK